MPHCLDAWAILEWLSGREPTRSILDSVLDEERPLVSWVNLVEVVYTLTRRHGPDEADATLAEIRAQVSEELPGVERMRGVIRLKSDHPIALGDCFAVATAAAAAATLLTGDPEIVELREALPCEVRDVRG